ncbi:MAG: DUF3160 domain-containing protein [bacterium]
MSRWLLLFILVPVLFLSPAFAQEGGFNVQAYQSFLANHQDLTAGQLHNMHPTATFRAQAGVNLTATAYLDSVIKIYQLTPDELALLQQNGFVVSERLSRATFGEAFLEIFKRDLPVFVSTDALLHALHRSYDTILQDTELGVLIPRLGEILLRMHAAWPALAEAYATQPEMLLMLQDVDLYLTLALQLLGQNVALHQAGNSTSLQELLGFIRAEQPARVALFSATPRTIDFSQFRPRGHYTQKEELKKYFQAMIWLGRTELMLTKPKPEGEDSPTEADIQRQIIVSNLLLETIANSDAFALWQEMESIIRFLVGESDNVTLEHLDWLAQETGLGQAGELLDDQRWRAWQAALLTKPYAGQRILSQILYSDPMQPEQIEPPSAFLLFGQRFVIDSYVMGNVVYDRVLFQGRKVLRMLPSALDVLFALGNNASAALLQEEMDRYPYAAPLAALRYLVDSYDADFWSSALYNVWLQAIRTLNTAGDLSAYPPFMQTGAFWQQKMNTQLSAWAQLRHDNLLYAKQSYTGGTTCSFPHSFVEPFPEFYRTLYDFAAQARHHFTDVAFADQGKKDAILSYFSHMAGVMDSLASISDKQLRRVALDSAETTFLKSMLYDVGVCGPDLTGWYPHLFYQGPNDCANVDLVVADVHTQPTDEAGNPVGHVLHAGTGPINLGLFVADNHEGERTAFVGPMMSYYEHVTMNFKRLTDEEWQEAYQQPPSLRPAWVNAYLADVNGKRRGPGPQLATSIEEKPITGNLPKTHLLHQNFPNPFNAGTVIRFEITPAFAHATTQLAIYNLHGEQVNELVNRPLPAGNYFMRWEGRDRSGAEAASGIYFYRLQVGTVNEVRKLTLLR